MKTIFLLLFAGSFLVTFEAGATFKAGQVYKLKKSIVFSKAAVAATMEGPQPTDAEPYIAFWSLADKKFQKTDKVGPSSCEMRIVEKAATGKEAKVPKGAIYKVSNPLSAEDANIQAPKNCMVMDAISEEKGAAAKPQIQFTCCADRELPTPASYQEFNDFMQDRTGRLLKLVSEN